ncbi:ATP-binding cassette domain-containing protein [Veillonella atypica]|jgi:putative uvrABC system protein A|uniref:ATP-binding cassette domain-containing protein n=1 Tax=Veillonella atypica TaxID=39777 RepID=UPI0022E69CB4|nr:ATP-binding cassette domain-containing protein [Veillonella atypica]
MSIDNKAFYKGIRTNILDNINVEIESHKITYIGGASGSGKSSLAFQTIADISNCELDMLQSKISNSYIYDLDSYENIQVMIPLKQLNFNVNPKSSVMTYFGLKKNVELLINNLLLAFDKPPIQFSILNYCNNCGGNGYIKGLNISRTLDKFIPLNKLPFKHWQNTYKDFYQQLLNEYLNEVHIDGNKRFVDLTLDEQNSILYKNGICNYKISYKYKTGKRHKTSKFLAVANEFDNSIFNLDYNNYSKIITCDECSGSRFKKSLITTRLFDDITIKNILLMPFDTLLGTIDKIKNLPVGISSAIASLKRYVDMCCRLGLGHLNLSRGIINLSGGELQRLRLAKILSGSLSGVTLVLDEPTSSLHPDEVYELSKLLSTFKRFNTLIIVEHNSLLADISDNQYYLSRVVDTNKSVLISKDSYEKQQLYALTSMFFDVSSFKSVDLYSNYVEYIGKIKVPIQSLLGICGASGCGKSTILKTILPNYFEDYIYVSQKPIRGNINSTVGSYTGLLEDIRKLYIKYTGLEKKDFQSLKCKKCQGKGVIDITNYYEAPVRICCDSCNGTGYNSKFNEYKIKSINFGDMLMMSLENLFKTFYKELSNKSKKSLSLLCDIGLGYLSLGRRVNTLSGGENQRLKLVSALIKNVNIIGLDEPCQGLDDLAIKRFIEFIYKDIDKNKRTYIVAEHNPLFLKYTSYIVELSRISDKTVILYNGVTKGIYDCADSKIAKWL